MNCTARGVTYTNWQTLPFTY